jgi:hypothetical protein
LITINKFNGYKTNLIMFANFPIHVPLLTLSKIKSTLQSARRSHITYAQ